MLQSSIKAIHRDLWTGCLLACQGLHGKPFQEAEESSENNTTPQARIWCSKADSMIDGVQVLRKDAWLKEWPRKVSQEGQDLLKMTSMWVVGTEDRGHSGGETLSQGTAVGSQGVCGRVMTGLGQALRQGWRKMDLGVGGGSSSRGTIMPW